MASIGMAVRGRQATAPRSILSVLVPVLWALLKLVLPYVGTTVGLACLVAAAWFVALPFGLAAAGLAVLVLEWRIRG